jgi:hypothetical protein
MAVKIKCLRIFNRGKIYIFFDEMMGFRFNPQLLPWENNLVEFLE